MRAVLQRVSQASVEVNDCCVARVARGWLVLLGVAQEDGVADAEWLAEKGAYIFAGSRTSRAR